MAWSDTNKKDLDGAVELVNQWYVSHGKESRLSWRKEANYYVADHDNGSNRMAANTKKELYDLIHAYRRGLYALSEVK